MRRCTFEKAKNLTPHGLRHNFASWLARAGADPRALRDWMGHSDLKTTDIYDHYRTGIRGAEKLDEIGGALDKTKEAPLLDLPQYRKKGRPGYEPELQKKGDKTH